MTKIAVIGLGYVGLPLAQLFASKYKVVGFDIDSQRIADLSIGVDTIGILSREELDSVLLRVSPFDNSSNNGLYFSDCSNDIAAANVYILTIPTPVDNKKKPDLTLLFDACKTVSKYLQQDDVVIFESTVYPGLTEEECVPLLEAGSGLIYNQNFFVGYSPERVNPGDRSRTIAQIQKITSGSNPEIARRVDVLYKSVISSGTYLAPSIKVAEAAKVIENTQRDINIAFVNELAKIFNLLDIDTHEVIKAASTKWNFMPFYPGLVGGHCIGVDPYYLSYKAQEMGYHPEMILAGRRINDSMGEYVASQVVKLLVKKNIVVNNASVLILGIAFKENCADVRNSKVVDMVKSLTEYGVKVQIYDPVVSSNDVWKAYHLRVTDNIDDKHYDAIVLAVAHELFRTIELEKYSNENVVIYDCKNFLEHKVDGRL